MGQVGDGNGAKEGDNPGKVNPGKPNLTESGAALSRPEACRLNLAFSTFDVQMSPFAPADQILPLKCEDQGADTAKNGPQFPLKDAYDPEAPYRGDDGKPTLRGIQLQAEARQLIGGVVKPDGSMSLKDHGRIMQAIADDKNLSEADRWYVYKQVCNQERTGRDKDGRLIPGTHNTRVLFDAERPTGLPESGKGDVVRHVVIDPTQDGYHGQLVYGSGSWRSGYMQGEDGIYFHEHIEKPVVNLFRIGSTDVDKGDQEASFRQLAALRAMQQGGFAAYSQKWNEGFAK